MKSSISSPFLRLTHLALASMLLVSAHAANETWKSTPDSGAWETGANWMSGSSPGATSGTTSSDVASFTNASTTLAVVPDASRNIAGITFSGASVAAYTIGTVSGNALLLSDGGTIQTTSTATGNNQAINAPLELQGDGGTYTFTSGSTKALVIGGAITGIATGSNTNTLTLNGSNTGAGSITNVVGDGAGGGKLALAKSGSGRWVLSGANSYSGGTTLNEGILQVLSATGLGTGTIIINGGQFHGPDANLLLTANNPMIWNGAFTARADYTKSFNVGTGAVLMTDDITITLAANEWGAPFTVGGNITDGGNAYVLTVDRGDAHPATLVFSGVSTYSGGTVLKGGVLKLNAGAAIGTGPITFEGGALGTSGSSVHVTLGSNPIVLNGSLAYGGGGSINFGTGGISLPGDRDITLSNTGLTFPNVIACSGGTGYGVTAKYGEWGTTLTLAGANTFDGGLTLLTTAAANKSTVYFYIKYLGVDATASALGTGTFRFYMPDRTLQLDNTSGADGTLATHNAQVWDSNFTFKGTRSLNMGIGAVSLGTAAGTNRSVTVTANTFTVGGAISDGTTANMLTKAGAGTLALGGANAYSGATVVSAGTLSVESGGKLGGGNVYVATGATLALKNSNAIGDKSTVELVKVGTAYGKVDLAAGVKESVGTVILGATTYTQPGTTFGSTASGAMVQDNNYFTGTGLLRITSSAGTVILMR